MSKKNYNKMYDNTKEPVAKDTTSIDLVEYTQIVEPASNTDFDAVDIVEAEQPIAAVVEKNDAETENGDDIRMAFVHNCVKLNVRENPDPNASVVMTINAGDEVMVYGSDKSGNYYSICTESGVEGYCIKDYLKMK